MIYKLSQSIAFYFVKEGLIEEDDADLYRFGVETICCSLVDVAVVLLTGLLLGQLWQGIWYFVVFCGLRKIADGYHAKTFITCKTIMLLMMVCVLTMSNLLSEYMDMWIVLTSSVLIGLLVSKCWLKVSKVLVIAGYTLTELVLININSNLAVLTMLAYFIVFIASNKEE